MTDLPHRDHELLAVFRDPEHARQAQRHLQAAGVPHGIIDLDKEGDRLTSLRAEMREELAEGWLMPHLGVAMTKEGARGFVVVTLLCSLIGVIIAAPFAFIDFGLSFWGRLILLVLIGLAFGATLGIIIGPALASRRPDEPAAAESGAVMHVADDTPEIRAILKNFDPIRIDEIARGTLPRGTVTTDTPPPVRGTAADLQAGLESDDFDRSS